MNKTVIIYKSKYGSTEKYAKWIAEATGGDIFKLDAIKLNSDNLSQYDNIVYCGGLYAGGMLGFSNIKKIYNTISDKKIIAVAVGATLKKNDALQEVADENLSEEMKGRVEVFLLRGALSYKKMNLLDRFLMFMLVKAIKSKNNEELDNDSKGILATYGKEVDFTKKDAIKPIIDSINKANR